LHRRSAAVLVTVGLLLSPAAVAPPASARPRGNAELGTSSGGSRTGPIDLATVDAKRWIVQLAGAPLAQRARAGTGTSAKLDVTSAESRAALNAIGIEQDRFRQRLASVAPRAQVQRTYQTVLNGAAVVMDRNQAAAVRAMSGVKAVTPDVAYHLDMYATPAQIGAPTAWAALGGQATAGSGVKVAIIDSGIYVTNNSSGVYAGNPCFTDAGYTAPPGFPKGDTRFTNNKVIVARTYFRADDPPKAGEETAIPGPGDGSHGTHVAGTVACNANTPAVVQGTEVTLSGVAPHAFLMNYRVFYQSVSPEDFQNGNAYVAELVAAMDDAVEDGADVMSNSWGSSYQNTMAWPDPMVQSAEAAADAGVTMVFAQGNAGPAPSSGNLPAGSPKVIAVGAVTKNTTISPGRVTAKNTSEVALTGSPFDTGAAGFGPENPTKIGPAATIAAEAVDVGDSPLACDLSNGDSPFPADSMKDKIALISRGTCDFSEKVFNAQRAGAIGAFVYNSALGGDNLQSMGAGNHAENVTIPSVFLRRSNGLAMVATNGGSGQYDRDPHTATNVGDVVAGFSSRGPTADRTIKPDVAAPGVDIISGGYNGTTFPEEYTGFGSSSGTSMATPHVAGAAALLKALHPTWMPGQIKSALMNTATENVSLTTTGDNSAGVLDRGAGRIDLSEAIAPGLTFDMPSVSGGEQPAGSSRSATVTATNVGGAATTWDLTTKKDADLNVIVSPPSITVPAGGTAAFTVTLGTDADTKTGDYEGSVRLLDSDDTTELHLPLWLRVVPSGPTKDVLLLDDDGSAADPGFDDYSELYQNLMEDLGLTGDYVDVWETGLPSLAELQTYRAVVLFTGDNTSYDTSAFFPEDHDLLAEYLDSGGRLYATGQNLAETTDSNTDYDSAHLGRSRLYHGYLGIAQDTASAYPVGKPRPTGMGTGILNGLSIDLTDGGNGADNQNSIEATSVMQDNDTYQAAHTVAPIVLPAAGGAAPPGAALGHVRSSEPSLEESRQEYLYRSLSLGFGLEGIRSDMGGASLLQVGDRTFDWLLDELTASIDPGTYRSAESVTLTATAASSRGTVNKYRWDFGDGTPFVTTTAPTVEHRFTSGGTYPVRLEVTDDLGHRVLAVRAVAVATGLGYRLASTDGGVFAYGEKRYFGSAAGLPLAAPIVGAAPTPSGRGYWLAGGDGGIFNYGDAGHFGSAAGLPLNRPIIAMAGTPSGKGYWLVASDGGVFNYGDAGFFGSAGALPLNSPIVGMAVTPTGKGYWLVAADGGVFAYGDAAFFGSKGGTVLNSPVVGMAASPTGRGYWLAAGDGGIFNYGDAGFFGSAGGVPLVSPVTSVAASPSGLGYWLAALDGGVFGYGDALYQGGATDVHPAPIVSIIGG
jgi:subtilisin family serine protease